MNQKTIISTFSVDLGCVEKVVKALEVALKYSIKSIGEFNGNTLVAYKNISDKSVVQNVDIGVVLGSLIKNYNAGSTIMGMFGDDFKVLNSLGGGGYYPNSWKS